jgi:hypothetical protein
LSFGRDFKDTYDSAPLWYKIFVIIMYVILIILYILLVAPFLSILTLLSKGNTTKAVSTLIVKEMLSPFGLLGIFFGD